MPFASGEVKEMNQIPQDQAVPQREYGRDSKAGVKNRVAQHEAMLRQQQQKAQQGQTMKKKTPQANMTIGQSRSKEIVIRSAEGTTQYTT